MAFTQKPPKPPKPPNCTGRLTISKPNIQTPRMTRQERKDQYRVERQIEKFWRDYEG